jgi:hypothetical protein
VTSPIELPDPFESEDDSDRLTQYVKVQREAWQRARTNHFVLQCESSLRVAERAWENYRRAKLHAWGVECHECGGSGEVPWDSAGRYILCARCVGDGALLPADHPEADYRDKRGHERDPS